MHRPRLNILLLTGIKHDYVPPEIEIPMYLASLGHNVVAVFQGEKFMQYAIIKNYKVIVPYKRIFHILNYINFLKRLQKIWRFNVVFASRNLLNAFACLFLKIRGIRTIFIVENPIEQSWVSRRFKANNKVYKFLIDLLYVFKRHFILFCLKRFDLIVAISHEIKQDIMRHGIMGKITVVPEGVQVSRFIYVPKEDTDSLIKRYKADSSILITYVGTLDRLRNLQVLIKAFSIVASKKNNVKLMLVGDGDDAIFLKTLADRLGILQKVIFTGWVNPKDIPKIITASDICISIVPPFSFYKASCPIKIHEYLAAGKPIVANEEIPEHTKVISESKGGILTTYDCEAIASAIIKIIDNQQEALKMSENGRKWIITNRSYDILVRHIEKMCLELLGRVR